MNLASTVSNPALGAVPFTVTRDPGSSAVGGGYFHRGFVPATTQASALDTFTAVGVITPADPKLLALLPEGDRISSVISILTPRQLNISAEGPPASEADIVTYHGLQYRVARVYDWQTYGYWQVLATQITAS